MKKTFKGICGALALLLLLTACGNTQSGVTPTTTPLEQATTVPTEAPAETPAAPAETASAAETQAPAEAPKQSRILVAYFSRVGNTDFEDGVDAVTSASINVVDGEFAGNAQLLAQMVQKKTDGGLFLIRAVEKYPSAYRDTTDQAKEEQNDDALPELAAHVENMDRYDTIILVYPIWWGTLPRPVVTFLSEYDFSGKTILPLSTHEGSALGGSARDIAALCPDATLLDGLAVRGSDAASAREQVEDWLETSGVLD